LYFSIKCHEKKITARKTIDEINSWNTYLLGLVFVFIEVEPWG